VALSVEQAVKLAEWRGWKLYPHCLPGHPSWMIPYRVGFLPESELPAYLGTWEGAGPVLEKMAILSNTVSLTWCPWYERKTPWEVCFVVRSADSPRDADKRLLGYGATPQDAICEAALKVAEANHESV